MGYDNLLSKAGDFGPYQKLLSGIFVFYTTFLCGLNYYTQVFIFSTPAHRCSDDVIDSEQGRVGASWEEVLPWVPRETGYPSSCHQINSDGFEAEFRNLSSVHMSSLKFQDSNPDLFTAIRHDVIAMVEMSPKKSCEQGWKYDHSTVFTTITSENNWVCEDDFKPMLIQTVFWVGNIIGCFVWGFTNDYFGRKPTVLLTHGLYFLAGAATLTAPNFTLLMICRAILTVSYVVVEYCGVSSRTVPLLMVMMSYSLASLTLPWVAMLIPSWRLLALAASLAVLPVLFGWKLIPESPSWLLVKGRVDEALAQLARVAACNKQEFKMEAARKELNKELESEATGGNVGEKVSLMQMLRTPNLRVNALLCTVICMAGFLCYYGMVQNTSNMGQGNVYMSYFLGALSEIPCWSVPFIIAKAGRRWTLLALFICSGLCSLSGGAVPSDLPLIGLTVALVGRMTANGAFFICLQYSSEIFPTVIRGKGVALCEIVGGIAIFLSPMIVYLSKLSPILPTIIFGLCSLAGAVATFFLPETAGKALPQTLKDGQEFGSDQTWWDVNWIRKDVDNGYLESNERMGEEALEKLMLPRVVSHISIASQSIV